MIKTYYSLIKPGMVFGNAIIVIGGFMLAAKTNINLWLFFGTLVGISLVIASGCVFNNYIDRDIDAKMARTKDRALVKHAVSKRATLIYGTCLGIAGFLLLIASTNILTVLLAILGFFFYVVMYSMWTKRRTSWGTVVGSISGAVPPVVGYCAVTNRFDLGAVLFFFLIVFWLMPAFYAIAIRRHDDYAAAGIPVLPAKKGIFAAKIHMLLYILAFFDVAVMLAAFGYAGYGYFIVASIFGLAWLALCIQGFWVKDNKRWARTMFFFSLSAIMSVFLAVFINALV